MWYRLCFTFIILLAPVLVYGSGVAPTGCAVVFARLDTNTLRADSYAVEPGVTNIPITKNKCVEILRDLSTKLGDQITLESYELELLANLSGTVSVAVPVDQTWSSPGPNGGGGGPGYHFDYYRAWAVATPPPAVIAEPEPVVVEPVAPEPVSLPPVTEKVSERISVEDDWVNNSTDDLSLSPDVITDEVPQFADDVPPYSFRESMLYGYLLRFLSWFGL